MTAAAGGAVGPKLRPVGSQTMQRRSGDNERVSLNPDLAAAIIGIQRPINIGSLNRKDLQFHIHQTSFYLMVMPVLSVCISAVTFILFVFLPIMKIPLWIPIPAVVMCNPTAIPLPETLKVKIPVITRHYPTRSRIWRKRPVPLMPLVFISYRIPITFNPEIIRARPSRDDPKHTRSRGCPDSDTDGYIAGN
jgi:hypothetical protein